MEKILLVIIILILIATTVYKRFMPKIEFLLLYDENKLVSTNIILWYNSYNIDKECYERVSITLMNI